MKTRGYQQGFTLIEMGIVLVIIATLATLILPKLSRFREVQLLTNSLDDVVSLIAEAHARTGEGDGGVPYGVHLESGKAVLFAGTTYTSGTSTNRTILLDSSITIASISLAGGGTDIKFDQITGDTAQYGTFVVKLASSTIGQKTVTISKTGLVSAN